MQHQIPSFVVLRLNCSHNPQNRVDGADFEMTRHQTWLEDPLITFVTDFGIHAWLHPYLEGDTEQDLA